MPTVKLPSERPVLPARPLETPQNAPAAPAPAAALKTAAGAVDAMEAPKKSCAFAEGLKEWATELQSLQGLVKLADPMQAIGLIKDCALTLELPMREGPLSNGLASIRPGTVMRLEAQVRDGVADFSKTSIHFEPALNGPLFADVPGLYFERNGSMKLEINGVPDPSVGPRLPARLTEMAPVLEKLFMKNGKLPVRLLGLTLAEVSTAEAGGGGGPSMVDLTKVRVKASQVSFNDTQLSLGPAGSLELAAGSKLELEGGLDGMQVRGTVGIENLVLRADGLALGGARGKAKLALSMKQVDGEKARVVARLEGLDLDTQYAVAARSNGDFISLAEGSIRNGSLQMTSDVVVKPSGIEAQGKLDRMDIGAFGGSFAGAKLTVPDERGTTQLEFGPTKISGNLEIDGGKVLFDGKIGGEASLTDYQARLAGASWDLEKLQLKTEGTMHYDPAAGFTAAVEHTDLAARVNAAAVELPADSRLQHVSVGAGTKVELKLADASVDTRAARYTGQADVDLALFDFRASSGDASMAAQQATLRGSATASASNKGVALSDTTLRFDARLNDGKLALSKWIELDLKAGVEVSSEIASANLAGGAINLDFKPGASLEASLDEGKLTLPGGNALDLKDGTRLMVRMDELAYDSQALPKATGSVVLEASVSAGQVNLEQLKKLPGIELIGADGIEQRLRLSIGKFQVKPDGSFEITDLAYGIEGRIGHIGGKITQPPVA